MDEARKLLERLGRIEGLRREDVPEGALLAEVRGLLRDGEAWLAAEAGAREGPTVLQEGRRGEVAAGTEVSPRA
jgi:hypothetical protein